MKLITRSLLLLLALPLASCSYFTGTNAQARDQAYTQAHSIPPLRIPPGVASSQFHNEYPVSDRNYPTNVIKTDIVPPGLS
jgi:uncharacterized lipoprotein